MARRVQKTLARRKEPKRARAQVTYDAIVIAAEKVLDEEGAANVTTTRIADVAGVSVGSLYQYFPNRDAILAALIERTAARYFSMFQTTLESARDLPLARVLDGLALGVRALFSQRGKAQGAMFGQISALGLDAVLARMEARYVAEIERFLIARREIHLRSPHATAYVVFHSCHGVMRAVSTSRRPVDDEAVATEVVRMLRALLGA